MLQEVLKTEFADFYYDEELSLLEKYWKNDDGKMEEEDFKWASNKFLLLVNEYEIQNAIVDTREIGRIVTPDLQQWIQVQFCNQINHELNKIAFILSKDIFEAVAVKQTAELKKLKTYYSELSHFTSREEAREWMTK